MKTSSKGSEKITAALIAVLMILICFTTACQPTPEKPSIIGKKGDDLVERTPAPESNYEAPVHWEENLEGLTDDTKIEIDADIKVPNVNAFPVVKVEPEEITQDYADNIINFLIGDAPILASETRHTKEEILNQIMDTKKSISDPNSDFNEMHEKGTPEYDAALQEKQATIEYLEKALKTAPDTIEVSEVSRSFQRVDWGGEAENGGGRSTEFLYRDS